MIRVSHQKIFYYLITALFMLAILDMKNILHFPFKSAFELILILIAAIELRTLNKQLVLFVVLAILYITYNYLLGVYDGVSIIDLTIAYKCFFYVIICSFFVRNNIFDKSFIVKLFNITCIVFLIKYVLSVVFKFAPMPNGILRPELFYENNFELVLLLLLWVIKIRIDDYRINKYDFCIVVFIVLLSYSRVTLLELMFLLAILFFRKRDHIILKSVIMFTVVGLCYYVFLSRDLDFTQIDRYKLFLNFLYETRDWNILDWFLGSTGALHTLSTKTCSLNSFYIYQFNMGSHSHYGECYSNIFHSFDLRVIFDHGILGLIFILLAYFIMLRKSGVDKYFCFMVLGIVLINGLSVSGFNNIFAIIGIMLVLGLRKNEHIEITRN